MRHSIVWLAVAAAVSLLTLAAVNGWRTAPRGPISRADRTVATPPAPARHAALAKTDDKQPPPPPLGFDVVTISPQGRAVIAGRAAAGDRVRVMADGKPLGSVTADASGQWVLLPAAPIPPGRRVLSLEAAARDGRPARHSQEKIAVSVLPPGTSLAGSGANLASVSGAGEGHTWLVRRGNTLWLIARDAYGAGPRYTAIYAANRDQIHDPDLIYPGQQVVVPKR